MTTVVSPEELRDRAERAQAALAILEERYSKLWSDRTDLALRLTKAEKELADAREEFKTFRSAYTEEADELARGEVQIEKGLLEKTTEDLITLRNVIRIVNEKLCTSEQIRDAVAAFRYHVVCRGMLEAAEHIGLDRTGWGSADRAVKLQRAAEQSKTEHRHPIWLKELLQASARLEQAEMNRATAGALADERALTIRHLEVALLKLGRSNNLADTTHAEVLQARKEERQLAKNLSDKVLSELSELAMVNPATTNGYREAIDRAIATIRGVLVR